MTSLDLLKYLIDVQKIEKEDLAELIGIPQKKMDSVLSGAMPLKKKWLKNLSLYTGIPKEAILSGNFVLNVPEGEPAPVVKDAYVPEAIREANTQRLNLYVKKRYKTFRQDVVWIHYISMVGAIIGIIIVSVILGAFSMVDLSGLQASSAIDFISIMLTGLVPAIISVSISRSTYRFAQKGTPADEKNFKKYTVLAVVQLCIFIITTVALKWVSPLSVVTLIGATLPLIYIVFFDGLSGKGTYWKYVLSAIVVGFFFMVSPFALHGGERFAKAETETLFDMLFFVYFVGLLLSLLSFANIVVCHYYFRKRNGISKHFGAVSRKLVFKSGKFAKSIVAIVIALAIIFSTVYIAPVFVVEKVMAMSFGFSSVKYEPRLFNYEKSNIVFEENEDVIIVDNKSFTMMLPSYMVIDNESKTFERYKTEEKNLYITIYDKYNSFEGIFNIGSYGAEQDQIDQILGGLGKAVLQRYGFLPKSEYEYGKLMRMVYEDEISPFDRDLRLASIVLKAAYHFTFENFTLYLYEDAEKEISIKEYISQREDGKHVRRYDINGNVKGDYDKFVSIDIALLEDNVGDVDGDLVYKIINSIEMK